VKACARGLPLNEPAKLKLFPTPMSRENVELVRRNYEAVNSKAEALEAADSG
jgi:hypothetical protein